eukprot:12313626-Ditylum_brightwellii.AAC.1
MTQSLGGLTSIYPEALLTINWHSIIKETGDLKKGSGHYNGDRFSYTISGGNGGACSSIFGSGFVVSCGVGVATGSSSDFFECGCSSSGSSRFSSSIRDPLAYTFSCTQSVLILCDRYQTTMAAEGSDRGGSKGLQPLAVDDSG